MLGRLDIKNRGLILFSRYYDMFFIILVGMILIFPLSKINTDAISLEENRMLAKAYGFGKEFDQWLSDRFRCRQALIKAYQRIERKLDNPIKNSSAFHGKDAWLFYAGDNSISNFQNKTQFDMDELQKIEKNIAFRKELLGKLGISYFVFIAPDKNRVYGEKYPDYIHKVREQGRAEQLLEYLKKSDLHYEICFPLPELLKTKEQNDVYFRLDTHWNKLGAFVGYLRLMKQIQGQYPDLKFLTYDDVVIGKREEVKGDLLNLLQLSRKDISDVPLYTANIFPRKPYTFRYLEKDEMKGVETINDKAFNNLKVLFLRDSFAGMWPSFMAQTFARVKMIWSQDFNANYEEILKFKPDIVIQETAERRCMDLLIASPFVKEVQEGAF